VTRLFRVIPWLPGAARGQPGHPLHVDPSRQGGGRADNPRHYQAFYVSETGPGAVGEVFGDLATWSQEMFIVPWLAGAVRALATFAADPPPAVLDLDDPAVLVERGIRPTEVVGRDRERTQEIALSAWLENRWQGLRWWSWWRPSWRNQILWAPLDATDPWPLEVVAVEPLHLQHAAVRVAAEVLRRRVEPSNTGS
jgi:hypothetical protein